MKVILNKDLAHLGEEGDVKDVARGYARNYLFPRGIALPYNDKTVALFETKRAEIEERKALKRQDANAIKERLEATELVITVPAGANGKLYGAVTNQTIADELAKLSFSVERKRIEVPGNAIKNTGKYRIHIRLYETTGAELNLTVVPQPEKEKPAAAPSAPRPQRHRSEYSGSQVQAASSDIVAEALAEASAEDAAADAAAAAAASAE